MLPKTKSLTHACLVVHLLANNHSSAPTPHCCPPRMAHFLFSFLFIIAVRPEHTHANTIRRFSQTAVAALNLTDCCTCHPSSDTHEKNKKNLWTISVLSNKIIGNCSWRHLRLHSQMTLNKSTNLVVPFSPRKRTNYNWFYLWIQQPSWSDGPIPWPLK